MTRLPSVSDLIIGNNYINKPLETSESTASDLNRHNHLQLQDPKSSQAIHDFEKLHKPNLINTQPPPPSAPNSAPASANPSNSSSRRFTDPSTNYSSNQRVSVSSSIASAPLNSPVGSTPYGPSSVPSEKSSNAQFAVRANNHFKESPLQLPMNSPRQHDLPHPKKSSESPKSSVLAQNPAVSPYTGPYPHQLPLQPPMMQHGAPPNNKHPQAPPHRHPSVVMPNGAPAQIRVSPQFHNHSGPVSSQPSPGMGQKPPQASPSLNPHSQARTPTQNPAQPPNLAQPPSLPNPPPPARPSGSPNQPQLAPGQHYNGMPNARPVGQIPMQGQGVPPGPPGQHPNQIPGQPPAALPQGAAGPIPGQLHHLQNGQVMNSAMVPAGATPAPPGAASHPVQVGQPYMPVSVPYSVDYMQYYPYQYYYPNQMVYPDSTYPQMPFGPGQPMVTPFGQPMGSYYSYPYDENRALINKRRIIKRRTRTGCLTCRKRRIKCDERKPFCFNCERSRKVCLGYENLDKKKKPDGEDDDEDDGHGHQNNENAGSNDDNRSQNEHHVKQESGSIPIKTEQHTK